MSDKLKVIISGGGTGGHLYPAIALVKEIEKQFPDSRFLFFGTARGIEARLIPQMGYELKLLWLQGVQRKMTLKNLLVPFKIAASLVKCTRIILSFRPDVVIGTGGYVSGPALLTASLLGFPTLIQEQNSYPGVSTRLLAKVVDQVHLTFKESEKYFKDKDRLYYSGNPIRSNLKTVDRDQAIDNFGLDRNKNTLLIFGGSQGAHSLNMAILSIIEPLSELRDWQIIWGCGERDYENIRKTCQKYGSQFAVMPFIDDMPAAYSSADLVISRAGATTVAELQACGLPALLIPYPYAAAGHQEANARALVRENAVEMILDSRLNSPAFFELVKTLMQDEARRNKLGVNLKKLAKPNAAEIIVAEMKKLLTNA